VYRVAFFDTDAMGVVHHSNYIRIMEIARVEWMRSVGLMGVHIPFGELVFGVTKATVEYRKPAIFDDEIEVFLEGRLNGAVIELRYALWCRRLSEFIAYGATDLAPLVAGKLTPTRFPLSIRTQLREMPWSSEWPPEARP
jgi:acyl-CoA thioester hydrolase